MEITLKITKKRVIAAVAAVAAVSTLVGFMAAPGGGGGMGGGNGGGAGPTSNSLRTVTLEKRDIASAISATGTIYSASSTNVYSDLKYTVQEVLVDIGDKVSEGDVLARLDQYSLQSDVEQKQASMNTSAAKAQLELENARLDLENYKRDAELGYDSTLTSAQDKVVSAEMDLANAEIDLRNAEIDVDNASNEVKSARREYRDAQNSEGDYEDEDVSDSKLNSLKDAITTKENSLEKAQSSYEKTKSSLEKAKRELENAQTALEAAKVASGDSLTNYENKVRSAQLSADQTEQALALQQLQEDLAKCEIVAPASGTITAVNAVKGDSGEGVLFVIQSEDNLKIITNIQEYDIDIVNVGDKVAITTEATGDEEFAGTLAKIAPTSTLTAAGDTTDSTEAEFEAVVSVDSAGSRLRIGMNAQLSIITEEHKNIFAVPFEAVATDPRSGSYIFEASEQAGGTFIAKKHAVTTGIENDLYVEVAGDALTEGMLILRSASGIEDGQTLELPQQAAGANGSRAANAAEAQQPTDTPAPEAEAGEQPTETDAAEPQGERPAGMPEGGARSERPEGMTPPQGGGREETAA